MNLSKAIIQLLNANRVEFKYHGEDQHVSKSNWIGLRCPWCHSQQFHYGINIDNGASNCWSCGTRKTQAALSKICKVPYNKIKELFKDSFIAIPQNQEIHDGTLTTPKLVQDDLNSPHMHYLAERGFNYEEIQRLWNIKSISIAAKLSWRLFIPIHDYLGNEVSWTTRSLSDTVKSRYISAKPEQEDIPHKQLLYGAHLARHIAIITEGPLDAWAIGPGAVATFGLQYTSHQFNLLTQYPTRIVCFDNTKQAQQQAEKLCNQLSVYGGITENVLLESGSDPADADKSEVQELRSKYLLETTI